jgi:hypothetical protein
VQLLFLTQSGFTAPQKSPNPPALPQVQTVPGQRTPGEEDGGITPDIQKQMQKKANEQRQAELKRDTERLLKLSTELKEYVDKTNENVLSMDVIKKAEEIEKLAHNVKMKMRGSE